MLTPTEMEQTCVATLSGADGTVISVSQGTALTYCVGLVGLMFIISYVSFQLGRVAISRQTERVVSSSREAEEVQGRKLSALIVDLKACSQRQAATLCSVEQSLNLLATKRQAGLIIGQLRDLSGSVFLSNVTESTSAPSVSS